MILKVNLMFKKRRGFTLAEVLITLGIIGIIAALTIPTLMNNAQDNEFHTAAKKAYSVLAQATQKILYENSGSIWDNSSSDTTTLCTSIRDEYKKYIKYVKADTTDNLISTNWSCYKSNTMCTNAIGTGRQALALSDGMILSFYSSQNCSASFPAGSYGFCGSVIVDVNGNKPPNMIGRDTYTFFIAKDANGNYKIIPGSAAIGNSCVSGSTGADTSYGCTEYVINNQPLP